MDELNKGLSYSLSGKQAEEAVKRVQAQIKQWGLVMPDVAPLVLDFGLGDFEKSGETEFWIANENEAGYCGKFLFVFEGQTCPIHFHKIKLETFYIVRGKVGMLFGKDRFIMKAGDVLKVPVVTPHSFTGIESSLLLEVSKPSFIDDNYFENRNIPIGGNYLGK
jgi:mannose-6-phosphate isomerase-like protein (cupin superfamily)